MDGLGIRRFSALEMCDRIRYAALRGDVVSPEQKVPPNLPAISKPNKGSGQCEEKAPRGQVETKSGTRPVR